MSTATTTTTTTTFAAGYTPADHPGAHLHLSYLAERCIPLDLANEAGVAFITEKTREHYAKKLGVNIPCEALYFPYLDGTGIATYWRLRLLQPAAGQLRALAPAGVSPPPYVPTRITTNEQWGPTVPRFFVESPQKALALLAIGCTAIGLAGVAVGFHDPMQWRAARFLDLHPDLAGRGWKGVRVYVVPDAGVTANAAVALATAKLARILVDAGSSVRIVELPLHIDPVLGEADQGPDDFLYRHGPAAFHELVLGVSMRPRTRASNGSRMWRQPAEASSHTSCSSTFASRLASPLADKRRSPGPSTRSRRRG